MLFGAMALLLAFLLVFEAVAYWHVRNVLDEAAAEGARVAAAYDGTCKEAIAVSTEMVERHAPGWSTRLDVRCVSGPTVRVTITARSPGVLGERFGVRARVVERAPKER